MNLKEQLDALLDATAFDSTGVKVGAVRQVYVDDASGKITFATVSTGIFSADAIVPLHGARLLDDELHVDHTRNVIRDSPRPDNTEDALTPDQEAMLLEHYGIEAPPRGRAGAAPKKATAAPQATPGAKPSETAARKGTATAEKTTAPKGPTEPESTTAPKSAEEEKKGTTTTPPASPSPVKTPGSADRTSGPRSTRAASDSAPTSDDSGKKPSPESK